MKKWAQAVSGVLSLALALECVPFASEVQAAEQRPVLLEDLKATRAFVHAESYVGPGEVIDCNGDGCVDVYDLAKMKSELLESGLPSLTSLTADQWRIHIGENTEVTFTVNVVEIAELKSNAVKLFDEDGKQLAVMYDDGTNGDQIAYDGVYTAKVKLTSDEYRHVKYYAEAEGVQSNTHEIT
ncbi:MAG: hypothetical protein IJ906_06175, partial [Oscillospiraceae bacterium]|nr:hypothetical protein [Oscillospiraceae bacterium]